MNAPNQTQAAYASSARCASSHCPQEVDLTHARNVRDQMMALLHGESGPQDAGAAEWMSTHCLREDTRRAVSVCGLIRVHATWRPRGFILMRNSGEGFNRAEVSSPEEWTAAGHIGSGPGLLDARCDRIALLDGGSTVKLEFNL